MTDQADLQEVDLHETTSGAVVDDPPPPPEEKEEEKVEEPMDEFQIGMWHHYKNYGCPYCKYATISGPVDVMFHIREAHPNVGASEPTAQEED